MINVLTNASLINFVPLKAGLHMATTIVNTSEITSKIKRIMVDKLGVEASSLERKVSFSDDLGLDSLDILETFTALEKEFDISISDEDAERLQTVGSVIDYIVAKRG
jgi:acyl carrier protein